MNRARTVAQRYPTVILLVMLGMSSYGCGDSASIPDGPEVRLARLEINPGTLQPVFSPQITGYTVQVPATTTAVTLTATPEDSATTVTIAGTATKSLSAPLGTPGSSKDITIVLKAQSGSQSTYVVTVDKAALSSNTDLSALTVTPGALTPAFTPKTRGYTVNVAQDVSSVTVSATKDDPNATLSGSIADPGAGQGTGQATIQLGGPGSTTPVKVTVIAQNRTDADTYEVNVNRAAPASDNNLSALAVSTGSLTPTFDSNVREYDVNLAAADSQVTISATKSDPNAVMALNSVIAPAGTATGNVLIEPGLGTSTDVAITVTAQDQISIKTYRLKVNRPAT